MRPLATGSQSIEIVPNTPINDPISQALKAKYSIRSKLNEYQRWRDLALGNVLRGHAVFFPDLGEVHPLSRPNMPPTLIGCAKDLRAPKAHALIAGS